MPFRNESSPKKIICSKQLSLMLFTKRSAYAFKFGDRGGQFHRLDTGFRQHVQEFLRVQRIAIVNEISLSFQKALHIIGDVARNLSHPQSIRFVCNSSHFHSSCRQFYEEEDDKTLQTFRRPRLNREEV